MTTQAKENLKLVHFEHKEWIAKLEFFKTELVIFGKTLGEVAVRNNASEARAQVEHFQNQFILQKEKLDELKHDVFAAEHAIVNQLMDNPVAWDHQSVKPQDELRERMLRFDTLFGELKDEFRKFLEKVY